MFFYIDGSVAETFGWDNGSWPDFSSTDNLIIADQWSGDRYEGDLDEIMFFNTPISAAVASNLYMRQKGAYGGGEPGTYLSRIFDAGDVNAEWNHFEWSARGPYGKELPYGNPSAPYYDSSNVEDFADSPADEELMEDVIAYWPLNGTGNLANGAVIADRSGRGHDMTVGNGGSAVIAYGEGAFKVSLVFSEVDDSASGAGHPDFAFGTGDFSIQFWVKTTDSCPSWCLPLFAIGSDGSEVAMQVNPNGEGGLWLRDAAGLNQDIMGARDVSDGLWHHFVGVKSGSTGYFYLDGALAATSTSSFTDDFDFSSNGMGFNSYPGGARLATGAIDEAAVWKRALNAGEVKELYLRGGMAAQFQISTCANSNCSDASFVGPDGTAGSSFTEATKGSSYPTLDSPLTGRYFRYQMTLETPDTEFSPAIQSVEVGFD